MGALLSDCQGHSPGRTGGSSIQDVDVDVQHDTVAAALAGQQAGFNALQQRSGRGAATVDENNDAESQAAILASLRSAGAGRGAQEGATRVASSYSVAEERSHHEDRQVAEAMRLSALEAERKQQADDEEQQLQEALRRSELDAQQEEAARQQREEERMKLERQQEEAEIRQREVERIELEKQQEEAARRQRETEETNRRKHQEISKEEERRRKGGWLAALEEKQKENLSSLPPLVDQRDIVDFKANLLLQVENLKYDVLHNNSGMLSKFKDKVKDAIVAEAKIPEVSRISPDQIEIQISDTQPVALHISITTPSEAWANKLQATLSTKMSLASTVGMKIKQAKIFAACSGATKVLNLTKPPADQNASREVATNAAAATEATVDDILPIPGHRAKESSASFMQPKSMPCGGSRPLNQRPEDNDIKPDQGVRDRIAPLESLPSSGRPIIAPLESLPSSGLRVPASEPTSSASPPSADSMAIPQGGSQLIEGLKAGGDRMQDRVVPNVSKPLVMSGCTAQTRDFYRTPVQSQYGVQPTSTSLPSTNNTFDMPHGDAQLNVGRDGGREDAWGRTSQPCTAQSDFSPPVNSSETVALTSSSETVAHGSIQFVKERDGDCDDVLGRSSQPHTSPLDSLPASSHGPPPTGSSGTIPPTSSSETVLSAHDGGQAATSSFGVMSNENAQVTKDFDVAWESAAWGSVTRLESSPSIGLGEVATNSSMAMPQPCDSLPVASRVQGTTGNSVVMSYEDILLAKERDEERDCAQDRMVHITLQPCNTPLGGLLVPGRGQVPTSSSLHSDPQSGLPNQREIADTFSKSGSLSSPRQAGSKPPLLPNKTHDGANPLARSGDTSLPFVQSPDTISGISMPSQSSSLAPFTNQMLATLANSHDHGHGTQARSVAIPNAEPLTAEPPSIARHNEVSAQLGTTMNGTSPDANSISRMLSMERPGNASSVQPDANNLVSTFSSRRAEVAQAQVATTSSAHVYQGLLAGSIGNIASGQDKVLSSNSSKITPSQNPIVQHREVASPCAQLQSNDSKLYRRDVPGTGMNAIRQNDTNYLASASDAPKYVAPLSGYRLVPGQVVESQAHVQAQIAPHWSTEPLRLTRSSDAWCSGSHVSQAGPCPQLMDVRSKSTAARIQAHTVHMEPTFSRPSTTLRARGTRGTGFDTVGANDFSYHRGARR